ncbi:MAG: PIG-L family deacetylase [Treponema sp.]|jgi:LmbE family N-acetylglucosaminyl deacetylase|nr:PIG-L family deacetylase [Treponema sp.]
MNYLFVVSHPDDEILGAGATIYDLSKNHNVHVILLNSKDTTKKPSKDLSGDIEASHRILGIKETSILNYQDSEFHIASHRNMVEDTEKVICKFKPDFIFTHHPNDINTDHCFASGACQVAARAFQRKGGYTHRLKGLFFMEVQSSTDWSFAQNNPFIPNYFVEISKEALDRKIEALKVYENVIRPAPHPRSQENLRALPVLRGSQSGFLLAEAFQAVFITKELE